jgi:hypothetical protein
MWYSQVSPRGSLYKMASQKRDLSVKLFIESNFPEWNSGAVYAYLKQNEWEQWPEIIHVHVHNNNN